MCYVRNSFYSYSAPSFNYLIIIFVMGYNTNKPSFWRTSGGAAAISAAGGAASGLFGGLFSIGSQRRQYKYNMRLQRQQQDWQRMMWELENEYNLPVNEVKRLLDAGINPALAFSNGGAAAAPVPQSGSAGGVSAPTADMPNLGAAAVQAANAQSITSSQVDLNEALAEKARKEGNAAEASAEESGTRANLNKFALGLNTELRPVLLGLPRLNYSMRLVDSALLNNRLVRDNWDTSYHLQGIQLGQESVRLSNRLTEANIRRSHREIDLIGAQIALYVSQRRLTEEQANLVACRVYSSIGQAFIGKLRYDSLRRLSNSTVRVDGTPKSFSDALFQQISSEFASQLDSARTTALNNALDLSYQRQYGKEDRDYNFGLKKQQFYMNRANLWLGAEKFILDAAGSFIKPGMPEYSVLRSTSKEFGFNDLPPLSEYDKFYPTF